MDDYDDPDSSTAASTSPVGLVTQSPLAFALILVGLYWAVKILRASDLSRPPRAPYWIPWVGNAVEMGKDPDGFFSNMSKLLGPIFRVKTLGQEMIFVTDPSLISAVYRDSQNFNFTTIRVEMGEAVFAIRQPIVGDDFMLHTYMPELHRILLPSNLKPMTSVYLASAHDTLLSMISSMDGASGPLKTFIIPPAYRAAAHAGFGINFPAEKSYPLFKTFDENLHLISAGLPKFLLSKAWNAWDDLIGLMEAYVKREETLGGDSNPFISIALQGLRDDEWSYHDVATVLATQLWALQANAIYAAYWLVALLIQQPEGLSPLVAELDNARRQWQAVNPSTPFGIAFFDEVVVSSSKSLPLLSSAIQEVLRYTTSTFSMRRVVTPVTLGGFQLRVGDKVICATRHVHNDDEIHPQANELDIKRYLETPRPVKDGKPVASHSMPFGGGVSMCEGRHFATTELRVFMAILLTYASIEVDEECTARPEFAIERMGLGVMHPRGDIDVILRKRKP